MVDHESDDDLGRLLKILTALTTAINRIRPGPGRENPIAGAALAAARSFIDTLKYPTLCRAEFLLGQANDVAEGDTREALHWFASAVRILLDPASR